MTFADDLSVGELALVPELRELLRLGVRHLPLPSKFVADVVHDGRDAVHEDGHVADRRLAFSHVFSVLPFSQRNLNLFLRVVFFVFVLPCCR